MPTSRRTWKIVAFAGVGACIAVAVLLIASGIVRRAAIIPTPPAGPITVQGTVVCLPHRNQNGPQTLECAYGLKDDIGHYFALSAVAQKDLTLIDTSMNHRVVIGGTFTPKNDQHYASIGTIAVDQVTAVDDTTTTATTTDTGTTPASVHSGIRGTTMLGPTCPLMQNPPDPECADKPYQTSLTVTSADGSHVIESILTNADGTFLVTLPPGNYAIRPTSDAMTYPRCAKTDTVTVQPDVYTDVTVSCDSGIR